MSNRPRSWADAFSNRPFVLVAIIAVIVGLVVAAFLLRSRLPRRDWPFGVDVDRPTPLVEIDGGGERHLPSMQWPILEKIALIGLVGGIFSCVLDVDAAAWQVVGATLLLVLANAGISLALERRGHEWRSIAVEFVVLAAVNVVLLLTYAALVSDNGVNRALARLLRPVADDDHRPVRPLPRRTHQQARRPRSDPRATLTPKFSAERALSAPRRQNFAEKADRGWIGAGRLGSMGSWHEPAGRSGGGSPWWWSG